MKTISTIVFFSLLMIIFSCNKKTPDPVEDTGMAQMSIPNGFNFQTTKEITLTIHDVEPSAYDVYTITTDAEPEVIITEADTVLIIDNSNQLVASGFVNNGSWIVELTVPAHQKFIYVKRKKAGAFSGELLPINSNHLSYTHQKFKQVKINDKDIIYGVSGTQVFSMDIETGETTEIATLDASANACAVDKANNVLYALEYKNDHRLWSVNLSNGQISLLTSLSISASRMDYDNTTGVIYLSRRNKLYTYDPFSQQFINSYKIISDVSIHDYYSGDVSKASDGAFYFTAYFGHYLLKGVIDGDEIITTIVNTLPERSSGNAIGSDGYMYLGARSSSKSNVYKVNLQDGSAELLYKLDYGVSDFGILLKDSEQQEDDTDGDGVPDSEDAYPNDPSRAFNLWTPGENQWGTLAFEDLWPNKGDYDFNDMVVNYKFHQITNADNKVVAIEAYFKNVHNGAGLINSFGFELPISQNLVQNVSGTNLTNNTVTIAANGTEANQSNAVIIVYDNAYSNLNNELNVTVSFTQPIEQAALGSAPYNPFLIKNQDRDYEIHLSNHEPTALADLNILGTADDNSIPSQGRYYKTINNLPWVINIPIEFVWPMEKQEIINGYLKFKEWAESGGDSYEDWYLDNAGYRNNDALDTQD